MISITSLSLILTIWLQFRVVTVVAGVAARSELNCRLVERADTGVCGSGIYGELSPILSGYSVAVEFCQAVYPVKCNSGKSKRGVVTTPRAISTTPGTTPVVTTTKATSKAGKTTTTSKPDKTKSAWDKCRNQPAKVISTLCSCIQPGCKSTTAKTSKSTTPATTKKTTPATTPPTTTATTPSTTASTTTSAAPAGPTQTCSENGSIQASNGELYSHYCDYSYPGGTPITVLTGFTDVTACVEACSQQLPDCRAYNYNRNVDVAGAGASCTLLSSTGGSGVDTPGIDSGIYQV